MLDICFCPVYVKKERVESMCKKERIRTMSKTKRVAKGLFSLVIGLILAMSLVSCGSGTEGDEKDSGSDVKKVTLILDYVPNTNHTGFYVAQDKGYFKEQGLDVRIIEPGDNSVTTLLAAGKGDFGISFQEDVTYALTMDEPMPIKAVAAIVQHNTSGFASIKDKNITSPEDFEGKTYAGWGSPSEESVIEAVMKADGGDFSKTKITVSDGSGYELLKSKVDYMWFFRAWDGIAAERAGMDLNYFEVRDFDERLDYYTPVIIASDDKIKKDPETVSKFLAASKQGYEYCIENPDESAEILHKSADTYDLEMLKESQRYLADKYIDDARSWGVMKDDVWDNYTEFMIENKLIKKKIKAQDCYTNEFLDK